MAPLCVKGLVRKRKQVGRRTAVGGSLFYVESVSTHHPLWRPLDDGANQSRQVHRVAVRQTTPGPLQPHDPNWHSDFETVRQLVNAALGEQALAISHVGSTAVADLAAKPVIDIDLTVADEDDEDAYRAALEAAGFRLIFRDPIGSDAHRQFTLAAPNTNLHVWSPGAVEPQRHQLFIAWLAAHPEDRGLYETAKAAALTQTAGGRYNDRKARVVHEIYDRALDYDLASRGPEP